MLSSEMLSLWKQTYTHQFPLTTIKYAVKILWSQSSGTAIKMLPYHNGVVTSLTSCHVFPISILTSQCF